MQPVKLPKPEKKVTRHTRASSDYGKEIYCPECRYEVTVYHFAWSQMVCRNCKQEVSKTEWEVAPK